MKNRRVHYKGDLVPLEKVFPEFIWVRNDDKDLAIGTLVHDKDLICFIRKGDDASWCPTCECIHSVPHCS